MAGHQHGDALIGQRPQQPADLLDAGRVESVGRLVEDEQAGLADEGHGDPEPLLHAERIVPDALVELAVHPDRAHGPGDLIVAQLELALDDAEVLAAGQMGIPGRGLDQRPHLPQQPVPRRSLHRPTEDLHAPGRRADERQQHLHRRRLAGAVRPEEPIDAALGDAEIELLHDRTGAIAFGQVVSGNNQGQVSTVRPAVGPPHHA